MPFAAGRHVRRTVSESAEPIVKLDGVEKSFGAVRALAGVDLAVARGRMPRARRPQRRRQVDADACARRHARARHAARSASAATTSRSRYDVAAAQRHGIRCVFQELSLCPNLTVAENARIFHAGAAGLRLAAPRRRADPRQARRDFSRPWHRRRRRRRRPVDRPAPDGRDRPRLHRDRRRRCALVILDEPTSSLDAHVAGQLLAFVRRFVAGGGALHPDLASPRRNPRRPPTASS